MSNNGNGWKPRKIETITCPSGQVVQVKRPGPEFTLKAGRVARTFTKAVSERPVGDQTLEEYGLSVLEGMSDEDLAVVTLFGKQLVCAMMASPKLVLNPREGFDEIGPEDVPGRDFWHLFGYAMSNFVGMTVPVGESEVEVKDLETFRDESGISGDGVDGLHVSPDAEQPVGDQRLVDSAGA